MATTKKIVFERPRNGAADGVLSLVGGYSGDDATFPNIKVKGAFYDTVGDIQEVDIAERDLGSHNLRHFRIVLPRGFQFYILEVTVEDEPDGSTNILSLSGDIT